MRGPLSYSFRLIRKAVENRRRDHRNKSWGSLHVGIIYKPCVGDSASSSSRDYILNFQWAPAISLTLGRYQRSADMASDMLPCASDEKD
jgi:hypothetical protein